MEGVTHASAAIYVGHRSVTAGIAFAIGYRASSAMIYMMFSSPFSTMHQVFFLVEGSERFARSMYGHAVADDRTYWFATPLLQRKILRSENVYSREGSYPRGWHEQRSFELRGMIVHLQPTLFVDYLSSFIEQSSDASHSIPFAGSCGSRRSCSQLVARDPTLSVAGCIITGICRASALVREPRCCTVIICDNQRTIRRSVRPSGKLYSYTADQGSRSERI